MSSRSRERLRRVGAALVLFIPPTSGGAAAADPPATHRTGISDGAGDHRWRRILELEAELMQLRAPTEDCDLQTARPAALEPGASFSTADVSASAGSPAPRLQALRARAQQLVDPGAVAALGSHTIRYRELRNSSAGGEHRTDLQVAASAADVSQLVERGFLLRPGLLSPAGLRRLRGALDDLEASHGRSKPADAAYSTFRMENH